MSDADFWQWLGLLFLGCSWSAWAALTDHRIDQLKNKVARLEGAMGEIE